MKLFSDIWILFSTWEHLELLQDITLSVIEHYTDTLWAGCDPYCSQPHPSCLQ